MVPERIREHHLKNRGAFLSSDYRFHYSMRRLAPEIRIATPYGGGTDILDGMKRIISLVSVHHPESLTHYQVNPMRQRYNVKKWSALILQPYDESNHVIQYSFISVISIS